MDSVQCHSRRHGGQIHSKVVDMDQYFDDPEGMALTAQLEVRGSSEKRYPVRIVDYMNFIPTNGDTLASANRPQNPNLLFRVCQLANAAPLRASQMQHGLDTAASKNTDVESRRRLDRGRATSPTSSINSL